MRIAGWFLLAFGIGFIGASCGGSNGSTPEAASEATDAPATTEELVTTTQPVDSTGFAEEVLPIIEFTCARCHTGQGPGTPHLRLDTVADAIENSDLIVEAVGLGIMPPWHADPLHGKYLDQRFLTETEKQILITWAENGAELGDPAERPTPPTFVDEGGLPSRGRWQSRAPGFHR